MSKEGQTAAAKRDLAQALRLDESKIAVKSVKEKDWPDASLGLGKSGKSYAQMIVSGYIIDLEANGRGYRYHTDESSHVERAWS